MRNVALVGVLPFALAGLALARDNTAREPASPSDDRRRLCSIATQPWARGDPLTYVIIEARADTLPATVYRAQSFTLRAAPDTLPRSPLPGIVVHGQHVRIVRAVGVGDSTLATPADALLVEWSTNSMCGAVPPERPHRALSLPAGTTGLLVATPRLDTIAPPGFTVLHLQVGTRFYSPTLEREAQPRSWRTLWLRPRVLTLEEYEDFLRSLPTYAEWDNAPARAFEKLQAWASAHPSLARLEPVRSILRTVREIEDDRISREAPPPAPEQAELVLAATQIVAFLRGQLPFEYLHLADTVLLRLSPEARGARRIVPRDSLRNPSSWYVRSSDMPNARGMTYSFAPPRMRAELTTRVGRHLKCLEYDFSSLYPELAALPHIGTMLKPTRDSSSLESWNLTLVFASDARPVRLVAAVYDQWEW